MKSVAGRRMLFLSGLIGVVSCARVTSDLRIPSSNDPCHTSSAQPEIINAKTGEHPVRYIQSCGLSVSSTQPFTTTGLPSSLRMTILDAQTIKIQWDVSESDPRLSRGSFSFSSDGTTITQDIILSKNEFPDDAAKTLVLANSNSIRSNELALAYANARGISGSHICSVALPVGLYAESQDVLSLKKQITQCICGIIPENRRPNPCDDRFSDVLAQVSPIRHFAIMHGVPARILNPTVAPSWGSSGTEDPSLDYFISQMIYTNIDPFTQGPFPGSPYYSLTQDPNATIESWQPTTHYNEAYVRPLSVARDRMVTYGRIEGLTFDSAKALIDRTILAEQKGLEGNILHELDSSGGYVSGPNTGGWVSPHQSLRRFQRIFDSLSEANCVNYARYPNLNLGPWNPDTCRVGITTGQIPGEMRGTVGMDGESYPIAEVARAVDAGIFFGENPFPNTQVAFDDFSTMLNWRRTSQSCTPLCQDLPTNQIAVCRSRSKDIFRELNSDCIGVNPGFIGHQVRSWPVSFYGFFPTGWKVLESGGNGAYERIPPQIESGGAYHDSNFNDDQFARFGANDEKQNPTCPQLDGSQAPCPTYVPVGFGQVAYFADVNVLPSDPTRQIKFRYRLPQFNSTVSNPIFTTTISFYYRNNPTQYVVQTIPLTAKSSWTEVTLDYIPNVTDILTGMRIFFKTTPLRSAFDLDALEFNNFPSQVSSAFLNKSFSDPMIDTVTEGSWAAHVLDRMGGIAWWGSSSHFVTGGWAFANDLRFMNAFTSGRTLGESIQYEGPSAVSGIVYGDPLYRPLSIKIWFDGMENSSLPTTSVLPPDGAILMMSAYNGSSTLSTLSWKIEWCDQFDISACGTTNHPWNSFLTGTGAEPHKVLGLMRRSDLRSLTSSTQLTLRLIATRPDQPTQPSHSLGSYLFMNNAP